MTNKNAAKNTSGEKLRAALQGVINKQDTSAEHQTEKEQEKGDLPSKDKYRFTTYLNPEVHRRLKILAAKEGTSIEKLSNEAYGLLFRKYEGAG